MAAFQALGPFISTFADSTITSLLHNDNGEIVITDAEQLAERLDELEEKRAAETSRLAKEPIQPDDIDARGPSQEKDKKLINSRKTIDKIGSTPCLGSDGDSTKPLPGHASTVLLSSTSLAEVNENNNVDVANEDMLHALTDTELTKSLPEDTTDDTFDNLLKSPGKRSVEVSGIIENEVSDNGCHSSNSTENPSIPFDSEACQQDDRSKNVTTDTGSSSTSTDANSDSSSNVLHQYTKADEAMDMELVNIENELEDGCNSSDTTKPHLSHSKSDGDLSMEERRAQVYKDRSQQAQSISATDSQHPTTIAGNTTCLHTSESFNDFLYWREPVATLDIGEDSTATSNPQEVAGNAKVVDQLEEMEDEEIDDEIVLASLIGGVNSTRPTIGDTNKKEQIDLEDLDQNVQDDVEVVVLGSVETEEDDIELMVEPLAEAVKTTSIEGMDLLDKALKYQTDMTSESSKLLCETDKLLLGEYSDEMPNSLFASRSYNGK